MQYIGREELKEVRDFNPVYHASLTTMQHQDCISCLAYYHAEGLLFTGSWDKTVKTWVSDQRCMDSFVAHNDAISAIVVNQEDALCSPAHLMVLHGSVFTGSESSHIRVWKQMDFAERGYLKTNSSDVRAIVAYGYRLKDAISAIVVNQEDGSVFTCSSDGSVKIWRRVHGENSPTLTMTLKFQLSPVIALAISSSLNSCYLYSASSDGLISIWKKEKISSRFNHEGFLQGH
ncbi:hypothetical protein IFM89_027959 [Coptis chinensis]|uniref:Uncharacterized protein n=1 Tax=Coptis chinensis TaxID=261450 RepID=A0A835IDK1_9MAGN|nr:hypothetical protein IFM89_027959 [Coptis chinensis]